MKLLRGLRQPITDLDGAPREEVVRNARAEPVMMDAPDLDGAGKPIKVPLYRPILPGRVIGTQLQNADPQNAKANGWDVMLVQRLARQFYEAPDELELEDAAFAVAHSIIEEDASLLMWAKAACLEVFEAARAQKAASSDNGAATNEELLKAVEIPPA